MGAIAFSTIPLLSYEEESFLDAVLLFFNRHLASSHELPVSIFRVLQAFFLSKLDGLFFLVSDTLSQSGECYLTL